MDQRIEAVELKLMDLELTVEQLNNVVISQQQTIDVLTRRLEEHKRRLEAMDSPMAPASEETLPPHY